MQPREPKEFEEKIVQVSRVSKKTKGGNKMGFSVLVVLGDRKGRVGIGLGKSKDVLGSIQKGVKKARRRLVMVPMQGTTIPFATQVKLGAAHVVLKPAPAGSGIIAGGPVRAVVEAAGIRDISSKILGTNNKASNVYATMEAMRQLRALVEKKGIKLRSIIEVELEEKNKLREVAKQEAEQVKEKKQKEAEEKTEAKEQDLSAKKTPIKAIGKTTKAKKAGIVKTPAKKKTA